MVQNRRGILGRLEQLHGANELALWSYAARLVHGPVFMLIGAQLGKPHINANAPLTFGLVIAARICMTLL